MLRNIKLLAFFLLGVLLAAAPMLAFSQTTIPATIVYRSSSGFTGPSVLAACQAELPSWPTTHTSTCESVSQTEVGGAYTIKYCSNDTPTVCGYANRGVTIDYTCPSGWEKVGTQCVSNCTNGNTVSSGYFLIGDNPGGAFPGVVCAGGCLASFTGSSPAGSAINGGVRQYYAQGTYYGIGEACEGGADIPPNTTSIPPDSCGAGQYSGTINGKTVCVTASGDPVDSSQPSTQKTTTRTQTTNGDGSTTVTETTDNGDGTKTIVTSTYPPGTTPPSGPSSSTTKNIGEGTNPGETEQEQKGFCEENPDSPICRESEIQYPGSTGLYEADDSGKTFETVIRDFKSRVSAAPAVSGVSNFFNVSLPGGSCSGLSGSFSVGWGQTIEIDLTPVLCGSVAQIVYGVLHIGVMLVAAWVAFRIAFL